MLARRDSMRDSQRAIRSDGVASVGCERVGSKCRESSALKTGRSSGVRGSYVGGAGIASSREWRAVGFLAGNRRWSPTPPVLTFFFHEPIIIGRRVRNLRSAEAMRKC